MGKPLEMRGWAVKRTDPHGSAQLKGFFPTRLTARARAQLLREVGPKTARYTVVPVVVRELRG